MKKQHRRNFKGVPQASAKVIPWLTVKNLSTSDCEMCINGQIGKSWWDDSGTSSKEFRDALNAIPNGKQIKVRINSEGGSIQDGLDIYNAIKARRNDVTCCVDGYALSIASIIALAGGKTVSPKSSVWMIHEPWSMTEGDSEDHRKSADMLDKHAEVLASIYSDETGKSKKAMRDAMKEETWFTGEEAAEFGLADETIDDDGTMAAFAKVDLSKFQHVPQNILEKLSRAAIQPAAIPVAQATQPKVIMNKAKMLALLKKHGITPPDNATDDEILALVENLPVAQPVTAIAGAATDPLAAKIISIEAQLASEKKTRITASLQKLVDNCQLPAAEMDGWVEDCVNDETILARLQKLPAARPGGEPITGIIDLAKEGDAKRHGGFEPLAKIYETHKTPKARAAAVKKDWVSLHNEAIKRDARRGSNPVNTNTYSATLITSFLMDGSVTDLQNIWAPLRAFSIDYQPDPYKPKATGELKHLISGSTAQTNATNFESGDSNVGVSTVTMNQYTVSFQVSNSDLNSGLRMENLVTINTAQFANKVIEIATAPITVANFGNTYAPLISSSAAFGFSDLATLQGNLKKSYKKNLILDGAYIARVANTPGFFQLAGTVGGATEDQTMAWKAFGWDMIAQNTDWSGADPLVVGFACHPQAIAGIAGMPLAPVDIPGGTFEQQTFEVPGIETKVALYRWFNLATRTMWCSYDIMLGVTAVDLTAGSLVKSG
jgi:ATP-dependent Clp protease protease subunit